jgi:hypothetical protein
MKERIVRRVWLGWLCFLLLAANASAQSIWSVWVYDGIHAVQVDSAGAVLQESDLPVPAGTAAGYTLSRGLAVSPDGKRFAYTVSGTGADGAAVTTFIVYDVAQAQIVMSYQLPLNPAADALSLIFYPHLFNQTGGAVAYSYATIDDSGQGEWRLMVFEISSGNVIAELLSSNPAVQAQGYESSTAPYLLPVVRGYAGSTVSFALVPYYTFSYDLELESFQWDVLTGRVLTTNQIPNLSGDHLPQTGESVSPVTDERINYTPGQFPYRNALHVFRPEVGGRAPFFAYPGFDFTRAYFIQNSERVLALAQDTVSLTPIWLLVGRDGVSQRAPNLLPRENLVIGTPEGFVYVTDGVDSVLIAADTRSADIAQRPLWTGQQSRPYVAVWAGYNDLPPLPASGAWAQLAPPLFSAQAVIVSDQGTGITPEQAATARPGNPDGALIVNGMAIITTTEGDRLNMRENPGLTGAILARVDDGTQVVLLEGPVSLDGFVWWRIRLPTGLAGWVVESADSVRTLIPLN